MLPGFTADRVLDHEWSAYRHVPRCHRSCGRCDAAANRKSFMARSGCLARTRAKCAGICACRSAVAVRPMCPDLWRSVRRIGRSRNAAKRLRRCDRTKERDTCRRTERTLSMSLPGFSAAAALNQGSRTYLGASAAPAAAGVQPARTFFSASCSPVASDYNWHCTVRWGYGSCRGSSTVYADGQVESEYSCA